jgi:hypothetical protein
MINNTSPDRWDRIQAKSMDNLFIHEMIAGMNCSPFEAEAVLEKVYEVFEPLLDTTGSVKPGQIRLMVVDASVPPGVPLAQAQQRMVTLTLCAGPEDVDARRWGGVTRVRRRRLVRLAEEAFQQGGLLTLEDLSNVFNCGVRTLEYDLRALIAEGITPPLRSLVKDMGRAITHRRAIIELWLKGYEYSEIARKSRHVVESVRNYVERFKRCVALFLSGCNDDTVAFLARVSTTLTVEFRKIYEQQEPVPHRKEELENLVKKTLPFESGRKQR